MARRWSWLLGAVLALGLEGRSVAQTPNDRPEFIPNLEVSGEVLSVWIRGTRTGFPLATTGSVSDSVPGALGQPGTRVLGGDRFDPGAKLGGRLLVNYWLIPDQVLGVEANYFIVERASAGVGASNSGNSGDPVLARPFFNPVANAEDADPRALSNTMAGGIGFQFTTRLMGGEANLRYSMEGYKPYVNSLMLLGCGLARRRAWVVSLLRE